MEGEAGALLGPRRAARDETADGEAMIAPRDQLPQQLGLLGPADLFKAAVQGDLIVAAVVFVLVLVRRDGRNPIRHFRSGDEVAAAERDAIEPQVLCDQIEQPFAKEIGLEAARPAISA